MLLICTYLCQISGMEMTGANIPQCLVMIIKPKVKTEQLIWMQHIKCTCGASKKQTNKQGFICTFFFSLSEKKHFVFFESEKNVNICCIIKCWQRRFTWNFKSWFKILYKLSSSFFLNSIQSYLYNTKSQPQVLYIVR